MESKLLWDFLHLVGRAKPSTKYLKIDRYKDKYSIKGMCSFFEVSRSGGEVEVSARKNIESCTGKPVITSKNDHTSL
jgi:hypothetical protein